MRAMARTKLLRPLGRWKACPPTRPWSSTLSLIRARLFLLAESFDPARLDVLQSRPISFVFRPLLCLGVSAQAGLGAGEMATGKCSRQPSVPGSPASRPGLVDRQGETFFWMHSCCFSSHDRLPTVCQPDDSLGAPAVIPIELRKKVPSLKHDDSCSELQMFLRLSPMLTLSKKRENKKNGENKQKHIFRASIRALLSE